MFAAAMMSMRSGVMASQGRNDNQRKANQIRLWAGISVPQPVYGEGGVGKLQMSFAVVNDGNTTANPRIGASHLSINGIEPKDWPIVINNGVRSPEFEARPPGHFLSFGYQLGDRYFAKPGVYMVRWWGESFRSAPLTFRMVARQSLIESEAVWIWRPASGWRVSYDQFPTARFYKAVVVLC